MCSPLIQIYSCCHFINVAAATLGVTFTTGITFLSDVICTWTLFTLIHLLRTQRGREKLCTLGSCHVHVDSLQPPPRSPIIWIMKPVLSIGKHFLSCSSWLQVLSSSAVGGIHPKGTPRVFHGCHSTSGTVPNPVCAKPANTTTPLSIFLRCALHRDRKEWGWEPVKIMWFCVWTPLKCAAIALFPTHFHTQIFYNCD